MENDERPDVPVDLKPSVSRDLMPNLPSKTLPSEEAPQQFAAAPAVDLVELVAQRTDGCGVRQHRGVGPARILERA